MTITAAREAELQQAADLLLTARRTHTPIADLPDALRPTNDAEAFYIQDQIAAAFGPIGGYKIGARGPEGEPFFAPMPAAWLGEDGSLFRGPNHRLHGVEAEIAFQLTQDLPPRATPYTRKEITAAITCHPAIEILESAFIDPMSLPRETMLADLQIHGGFVGGPAVSDWQHIDWSKEKVTLLTNAVIRVEDIGTSPTGHDLLRLLEYLANQGASRTGGLKRGDWVTTGSWTGATWAAAGCQVVARFSNAGEASLEFAT